MSGKKLAIVIPACKSHYLDQTLKSIINQTNKNYNLYIGDDNSSDDIYQIVDSYKDLVDITYKKFDQNLGKESLAMHWKRCVEMTKGEEWIWLFSDDDLMDKTCVDTFLNEINKSNCTFDLYRFNCCIIDQFGNVISKKSQYPNVQSSIEFLNSRLTFQYHSYIVNYIFSRKVFLRYRGFVDFPAAWAADDATWILYAHENKIFTLCEGEIKWRQSLINISGNKSDKKLRKKKLKGTEQFINWIYNWSFQNNIILDHKKIYTWYFNMLSFIGYQSFYFRLFRSKIIYMLLLKWHLKYSIIQNRD